MALETEFALTWTRTAIGRSQKLCKATRTPTVVSGKKRFLTSGPDLQNQPAENSRISNSAAC